MSEWKEQSEDENDLAAKVHPFQPPLDWRDFWTILNGWREWLFIFLICVRSEDRLTTICNLVEAFKETTEHNCITENCRGWKKLDYKSKEGHCNAQPQLLTLFQSLSNKTKPSISSCSSSSSTRSFLSSSASLAKASPPAIKSQFLRMKAIGNYERMIEKWGATILFSFDEIRWETEC